MSRRLLPFLVLAALVACDAVSNSSVAEFWRPISEPNLQMSLEKAQMKLDFDLSQCHCGIYPTNVSHSDMINFEPDKQRLAETSETILPDENNKCMQQPSLVVSECMRERGWEVTNCSGRMPLPSGGSLCTAYAFQQ